MRLRLTLKRGTRAAWDALGFVCAASVTLFAASLVPAMVLMRIGRHPAALPIAALAFLLSVPPVCAGVCALVHGILSHDEPSYVDLWAGCARLYGKAVALGAVELGATAALLACAAIYGSRGGLFFLTLASACLYLLVFWGMNCLYHWPLLIAGAAGIITRDDGRTPGVSAALRNAMVITLSSPGYTLGLLALIVVISMPLAITGVGMALLGTGFVAFLATQATRDQLVRFGTLPEPPDPDAPVPDERWRVE